MTTNDRKARIGKRMAESLNLRLARGFYPQRWNLGSEYGTKTAVGVYETVIRVADEARQTLTSTPTPKPLPLPEAFGPATWEEFQASLRRKTSKTRKP